MQEPDEMLHQVGAFEPFEAKRVLALFEAKQIPFEVETDNSALTNPTRPLQFYFGMYPEGSKLLIFVPESKQAEAMQALRELFPV